MYPVSDDFLTALRKNHTVISRCDLYRQGELIAEDLIVSQGSVTDDSQAVVRRRANLTLPATSEILTFLPELAPADGGLWPLGNELKLYTGIKGFDLVPMGVFRISKPVVNEGQDSLVVTLDAYDRARAVNRARFTVPYVINAGTNYATAIRNLIQSRLPWLNETEFNFMTTNYTTPQLVFTNQDGPMEKAIEMAASMGAELFFDGNGHCVLRPEPDPQFTPSVFDYVEGEDSTLTSIGRDLDDEVAYNGVIVTGENTDLPAPVRAEAWDTNPNSPTYYDPEDPGGSVYGAVPYFITSQYVTTEAQAQDAADANLTRVTGIIEKIQFTAWNNPAHETGDVINVKRDRVNVNGVHILENFQLNWGEQYSMTGATRKRRVS